MHTGEKLVVEKKADQMREENIKNCEYSITYEHIFIAGCPRIGPWTSGVRSLHRRYSGGHGEARHVVSSIC